MIKCELGPVLLKNSLKLISPITNSTFFCFFSVAVDAQKEETRIF